MFGRTTQRANNAEVAAVPADRLRRVFSGALTLDEDRRQEARVGIGLAAAAAANAELRGVHVEGNRDWLARITRLLGQAAPHALTAEVRAAALRLVALTDGLAVLSVLDPQTYDAPTQEDALTAAIASAIRDLEG